MKGKRQGIQAFRQAIGRRGTGWPAKVFLLAAMLSAGSALGQVVATGGNATNDVGEYRIHIFTNVGAHTFTVYHGGEIEVLVVAGGGGGGGSRNANATCGGGGGGAGGVIYSNLTLNTDSYAVVVGDGGAGGADNVRGVSGSNSLFHTLEAIGGGGGGRGGTDSINQTQIGLPGGSGGGNGWSGNVSKGTYPAGAGTPGQGHAGGECYTYNRGGGGGGGAGAVGGDGGSNFKGGDGGIGTNIAITGEATYYAGGGGAGRLGGQSGLAGVGGDGGGGNGCVDSNTPATPGDPNTGGGGGGGSRNMLLPGAAGGSGIVIVRYTRAQATDPLFVAAGEATGIGTNNAQFNGFVVGFGGEDEPHIYFCWGTEDGLTSSTGNWQQVVALGNSWSPGQPFSHAVSALDMGETYSYRVYATNSSGVEAWSDVQSFTTIHFPEVTSDGAAWARRRQASLAGTLQSDGGGPCLVWLEYWPDAGAVTSTVPIGTFTAQAFGIELDELDSAALYHFRFAASNQLGVVRSADDTFTTLSSDPIAWHVATNGNHGAATNWKTALNSPRDALAIAEPGDTIRMAGHTFLHGALGASYPDNTVFLMQNMTNITVRGGYQADLDLPPGDHPGNNNPALWPTILTSVDPHNIRILTLVNASNILFHGLTVTNGISLESDRGGGVHLVNSRDVTFAECRIVGNQAHLNSLETRGGGLYLASSRGVMLTNSVVAQNVARYERTGQAPATASYGGGAYVDGSSDLSAVRSFFLDNKTLSFSTRDGFGGAVYVATNGQFVTRETVFAGNLVTRTQAGYQSNGGAIDNRGTLDLFNCLVVSNRSDTSHSDGIFVGGGTARIVNCTVADNYAVGIRYGGGTLGVTNTIIWGHSTVDLLELPVTGDELDHFSHSLYGTATTGGEAVNMHGIEGCIVGQDPLFDVEGEHPFSLQRGSPAINRGINQDWITGASLDLAGNRRKVGGNVDMGAYEATGIPGSMFMFR